MPWGTLGDLASAAFVLAAVSGAAVAVPYDVRNAYGSLASLLLANPPGAFLRNVHYWAGQLCLVLTVLHVWDHLRAQTERQVTRGVWLRLAAALPLVAFIMLSGFLLRGDADARQALRILADATAQVPALGPLLATLLLGGGERLDVVYVQHAATATIAVWLIVVEHARRGVWPRASAFAAVTVASGTLALALTPGLHDALDPVIKGPWYFLGLQEALHWSRWPLVIVLAGLALLGVFYGLRSMPAPASRWTKRGMAVLLLAYAVLCGVGGFLRGENWAWKPAWPSGAGNLRAGMVFGPTPDAPATLPTPLPEALGRPEGCLVCHAGVTGLGASHRPDAVGCASCHGGDIFTLEKTRAHRGMETIAGNLATARLRCGQAACHPTVVPRVERSVMTTMSGIVDIDRRVFGEVAPEAPALAVHVGQLSRSPADTHLRQLCASCHVGAAKLELGSNHEDSRGGGCNACHLVYGLDALEALARYEEQKTRGRPEAPRAHPALSLDIGNGQCFGCHSRSGRIATNFEGWHEMHDPPASASDPSRPAPSRFRALEDERVFERAMPDIHQQRGLDCIDCHTANEVMGDGTAHARKSRQLRVACEDCHARPSSTLPTVEAASIDPESRKILAVRGWPGPAAKQYVRTPAGDVLVNVVMDSGRPVMLRKSTAERRELKPARPVCVESKGHVRLSCGSCHTSWAPRCPTCHTSFDATAEAYDWIDGADVRGAWQEETGAFAADPPTLGVRRLPDASGGRPEVIDTFVPGMILTIGKPAVSGLPATALFRRLYARIEPHTTRREARTCESCHTDPRALGFGSGELRYERTPSGGRWRFTPAMAPLPQDGLPADAWIPFLGTRTGMVSTRDDVRPFSVEEQRRVLRVGACLTCHGADSRALRDSVRDFESVMARRSPRCLLPAWN